MATASGGTPTSLEPGGARETPGGPRPSSFELRASTEDRSSSNGGSAHLSTPESRLFTEGYAFDFFQAVRLLERLLPVRRPVGRDSPPGAEIARFRAYNSLTFPPSSIYDIARADGDTQPPVVTVAFMGLTGPSGVLPRHYTEMLLRLAREAKGPERYALSDWFDLFNHRFISLFYRAWEKYRFTILYERGEYLRPEPDAFTRALFSMAGMGMPALRNRLRVSIRKAEDEEEAQERVLAGIDDLCVLYYGGLIGHRPRCAVGLESLLQDYFQLPVAVRQFQGQWLYLDSDNQSRLGGGGSNQLGVNLVAGNRVWDVQSKIRIRLGPLPLEKFTQFLPDRAPNSERKAFFLLVHWVRLYVGPELDFDVQIVLRAADVPPCHLGAEGGSAPRLGWNTWLSSGPFGHDAEDAVFAGEEVRWLN
jgi:type VI secretion system protein ImpH